MIESSLKKLMKNLIQQLRQKQIQENVCIKIMHVFKKFKWQ